MDKQKKQSNNILYIIAIIMLIFIAIWAFFIGEKLSENKKWNDLIKQQTKNEKLIITVIDDKRCKNCQTDEIISQLKSIPSLSTAEFKLKDFSESEAKKILNENEIDKIPAFIFSNDNVDSKLKQFLIPTKNWKYNLNIWATFDPNAKRSNKGLLLLDKDTLNLIKNNSYIKWNKNAKITWLEYSDLECPFCAKLHNSNTSNYLENKYKDNLNIIFNHFPLWFHKNALDAALILECLWEQKWTEAFYSLIKKSYKEENSNKDFLINEATKLWADKVKLENCLKQSKYLEKIKQQQNLAVDKFNITWTPWNVLINNETWEYEIIHGAYPTSEFEKIIDLLLK